MIETTAGTTAVVLHRPHISWTSITAGWVVAMGIAWLFYIVGLAVGFSSFDLSDTESVAKGIGIGTTVWVILTWAASLYVGGMFASWVDGRSDPTVGTLHGVAVWGLALTITAVLTAFGLSNFLQGTASLLGHGATATAMAGTAAAGQRGNAETPLTHASGLLGAQIDRAVAQSPARTGAASAGVAAPAPGTAPAPGGAGPTQGAATAQATGDTRAPGTTLDADSRAAVALDLLRGHPDDAKARLMASSGLSSADADAAIQSVAPQTERLKAQIREAADQARRYTAAAMWAALLSGILALVAAALGGWVGATHIHRVHDARRL